MQGFVARKALEAISPYGHLLPREKASITQKHLRPKTQVLLF